MRGPNFQLLELCRLPMASAGRQGKSFNVKDFNPSALYALAAPLPDREADFVGKFPTSRRLPAGQSVGNFPTLSSSTTHPGPIQ